MLWLHPLAATFYNKLVSKYRITQFFLGVIISWFLKIHELFSHKKYLLLNHTHLNYESNVCRIAIALQIARLICLMAATFKIEKGGLPDSHGPLAKTVPSSSIASEFKLLGVFTSLPDRKKRESYAKYTPEQKALIAKQAAEHGVVTSYHRFYLKGTSI